MKIQWLGHSSFRLEESTGTVIVTDPYENPGKEICANAVTISHMLHKGHIKLTGIKGNPTVLNKTGAFEIMGIHISSALSYHGNTKGSNLIFMYRLDGVDVCNLGEIAEKCDIRLIDAIGEVDILLVPIGGNNTIDPELAKEYVDKLMPDIVIPMNYKSSEDNDSDNLDEFLSMFDDDDIEYMDGDTLEVDRAQFDGEYTKVIVFKG